MARVFCPSGKLTVTFPKKLEDCPAHKLGEFAGIETVKYGEGVFVGYRYFSSYDVEPLFCFGHGLSYTEFKYDNLQVLVEEKGDDLKALVSYDITNIGAIEGAEISQVYVGDLESSVHRPNKELKGFNKISLLPGETKRVELSLDNRAFAFYDVNKNKWNVEKGKFNIMIGSSVEDIRLSQKICIDRDYIF